MYHMTIPASLLVLFCWLSENADALMNASQLLGGARAARRTARLLEDLRQNPRLNMMVRRELHALRDLLSLEHADDPDCEESAFFALIDPADPVVYDICMLKDGLEAHLDMLPEPGAVVTVSRRKVA